MRLIGTPLNRPPDGAITVELRSVDGISLRAARWVPTRTPRGTVAIFGGRAEFIEKYFETIADLLDRGFCVATIDWRGQGGSERQLSNPNKHHIDDFSLYERDFAAFVNEILAPYCPRPHYGLAHSMGAAILLMIAHSGRLNFERVVLTSPMIAIANLKRPKWIQGALEAMDFVGLGGAFAPGGSRTPMGSQPFDGNPLTSDPARFARMASSLEADPGLRVGWPTIGWLHAAFRLMQQFESPNYPREISTPILVVASGSDRVVNLRSTERFSERLRSGRLVVVEGAEHEVLIERDLYRQQFWAAFDAFLPLDKLNC